MEATTTANTHTKKKHSQKKQKLGICSKRVKERNIFLFLISAMHSLCEPTECDCVRESCILGVLEECDIKSPGQNQRSTTAEQTYMKSQKQSSYDQENAHSITIMFFFLLLLLSCLFLSFAAHILISSINYITENRQCVSFLLLLLHTSSSERSSNK